VPAHLAEEPAPLHENGDNSQDDSQDTPGAEQPQQQEPPPLTVTTAEGLSAMNARLETIEQKVAFTLA
jgi:hypothetical protein